MIKKYLDLLLVLISLIISLLVLTACGKKSNGKGTTTTLRLINGYYGTTLLDGGVIISGFSEQNQSFFSTSLTDSDQEKSIQLDNGEWFFGAIGWTQLAGHGLMSGSIYCSIHERSLLDGGEARVTLDLSKNNCSLPNYGPGEFFDSGNNQFYPLTIVTCNPTAAPMFDNITNCDGADKGVIQSFRVIFPTNDVLPFNWMETWKMDINFNEGPSWPFFIDRNFSSPCYDIPSTSSYYQTGLALPLGNAQDSMFFPIIIAYNAPNYIEPFYDIFELTSEFDTDTVGHDKVIIRPIDDGSIIHSTAFLFDHHDEDPSMFHLVRIDEATGDIIPIQPVVMGLQNMMEAPFNRFVFAAGDPANGHELWVSDGTATNTYLLKDINPGAASSDPTGFRKALGKVFFWANDGTTGKELWTTNGTTAGTFRIGDINPGVGDSHPGFDSIITEFSGKAYFYAEGPSGDEIYLTDGTANSAQLLKQVNTINNAQTSEYNWIGTDGNSLYFSSWGAVASMRLWKSDGIAGNVPVEVTIGGVPTTNPKNFFQLGTRMYFRSTETGKMYEPHYVDNGGAMTLLKDINPDGWGDFQRAVDTGGGTFVFYANTDTGGRELYLSDGTTVNTVLVKDINPGAGSSSYNEPMVWDNPNGTLYFSANDGTNGVELWKSNRTNAGTVMVRDINPGATGSNPKHLTVLNGKVYFWAWDSNSVWQIWRSDGTATGTIQLTNFTNTNHAGGEIPLIVVNGIIYTGMMLRPLP